MGHEVRDSKAVPREIQDMVRVQLEAKSQRKDRIFTDNKLDNILEHRQRAEKCNIPDRFVVSGIELGTTVHDGHIREFWNTAEWIHPRWQFVDNCCVDSVSQRLRSKSLFQHEGVIQMDCSTTRKKQKVLGQVVCLECEAECEDEALGYGAACE